MWLTLSLLSALFLGLNEVAKKSALNSNAVIPVLAVSIWISALLFLPLQISSMAAPTWIRESAFYIPPVSAEAHWGIVLKAVIVLGSWIFGFFATKHLPLTISASIKATRPAFVVLGAVLIFGERLDATRWTGVAIVLGALAALSRLDKRDGRDDRESPRRKTLWLWFLIASTLLGAASALWDKFLIARYDRLAVQAYTCYYQSLMMIAIVMTMWYPSRKRSTPFRWRWSIFLTAVLLRKKELADTRRSRGLLLGGWALFLLSCVLPSLLWSSQRWFAFFFAALDWGRIALLAALLVLTLRFLRGRRAENTATC